MPSRNQQNKNTKRENNLKQNKVVTLKTTRCLFKRLRFKKITGIQSNLPQYIWTKTPSSGKYCLSACTYFCE